MARTDVARSGKTAVSPAEAVAWAVVLLLVVALAVPWFLWRSSAVAYGLPVWLWWHVGWMVVASLTFYAFGRRAWGLGVEP